MPRYLDDEGYEYDDQNVDENLLAILRKLQKQNQNPDRPSDVANVDHPYLKRPTRQLVDYPLQGSYQNDFNVNLPPGLNQNNRGAKILADPFGLQYDPTQPYMMPSTPATKSNAVAEYLTPAQRERMEQNYIADVNRRKYARELGAKMAFGGRGFLGGFTAAGKGISDIYDNTRDKLKHATNTGSRYISEKGRNFVKYLQDLEVENPESPFFDVGETLNSPRAQELKEKLSQAGEGFIGGLNEAKKDLGGMSSRLFGKAREKAREYGQKGAKIFKDVFSGDGYKTLTPEQLKTAREALDDEGNPITASMSPIRKAFLRSQLATYDNAGGSKNFDRYYNPFLTGWDTAASSNIPDVHLKNINYYDSPEDRYRKTKYNQKNARLAMFDSLINKAASGVGSISAATGGLPGALIGTGIAQGVPVIWDQIKRWRGRSAQQKAREKFHRKQAQALFRGMI